MRPNRLENKVHSSMKGLPGQVYKACRERKLGYLSVAHRSLGSSRLGEISHESQSNAKTFRVNSSRGSGTAS